MTTVRTIKETCTSDPVLSGLRLEERNAHELKKSESIFAVFSIGHQIVTLRIVGLTPVLGGALLFSLLNSVCVTGGLGIRNCMMHQAVR